MVSIPEFTYETALEMILPPLRHLLSIDTSIFERSDSEAETPILWPPDVKNWLIGKDPGTGKDWRQEKGIEDEMIG